MQGAIILVVLTVILFGAAAALPAYSGLFVLAGLGCAVFAGLAGLSLLGKK
jgi:uncharacterized membrane protein